MRSRGSMRTAMALVVIALVLVVPGTAFAGGWWSFVPLEGDVFAVGEEVRARRSVEVLFHTVEEAERAREGAVRYLPHLVPGLDWRIVDRAMKVGDPGDWWVAPEVAIPAGSLTVLRTNANLAFARMVLEVPSVPPGDYALMLCTAGCEEPLGDIVPSRVSIVTDPTLAQTARRLDRLQMGLTQVRRELWSQLAALERRAEERIRAEEERSAAAGRRAERVQGELVALRADLEALSDRTPGPLAQVGWFLAGLVTALSVVAMRRRRTPSRHPGDPADPAPVGIIHMDEGAPSSVEIDHAVAPGSAADRDPEHVGIALLTDETRRAASAGLSTPGGRWWGRSPSRPR